jgi:hypothetical protein
VSTHIPHRSTALDDLNLAVDGFAARLRTTFPTA